ncbi:ascorbate peroxidase [Phaeodactylum tricornutum CCAP 1055/1]|uniref:Ascorbate peroxidase n=2 Tax=Phaeodactylum tricornutum TaxID=2850 RepID=B7G384_PHATC|nr:ascorbate peroxidase [Phaeodactylum tricornutum CCAP 1055/1]EEC46956.1 ascorbate peroxidase [Phaeodactylum tricornutum CCAP 1055/1]|eukprot:XP_002181742.1 ascorbate peroxidase [Phaeodactylum tricornutum CCAP 1055/1]
MPVSKEALSSAKEMIDALILEKNCGPIMVRVGWHDSGTFDKNVSGAWPSAGGAVGSIRFDPEITHGANAGLINAIKLLEPIKEANPDVSYADIFQMASARSIELAGGPRIDMKYGRIDSNGPENCSKEGNLPDAEPGSNGMYAGHLRKVFYRMGLNDEEIVALSGAHTFGRAYKNRSGGSSWTENFLIFDNSYYKVIPDESADPELLKLSTDKVVFMDDGFRPFAEKFRDSQDAFFESYAKAHKKLSELGSNFDPSEGISM